MNRSLFTACLTLFVSGMAIASPPDDSRFSVLVSKAQSGDAQSQYDLAMAYYIGSGTGKASIKRWNGLRSRQKITTP